MRNTFFIWVAITAIFLVSCKKDKVIINPVPFLKFVSISPDTVQQFQQKVTLTIAYEDGDGDLGFFNPDSLSLWVTDSRLTTPDGYHIQPLAPPDEQLHIKGDIKIDLRSPFLLGAGAAEIIHYSVQIKDRAGHLSNILDTPELIITP